MARVSKQSKEDSLKWRAESIVREAFEGTSEFGKAVKQTLKELKQLDKSARQTLKRK